MRLSSSNSAGRIANRRSYNLATRLIAMFELVLFCLIPSSAATAHEAWPRPPEPVPLSVGDLFETAQHSLELLVNSLGTGFEHAPALVLGLSLLLLVPPLVIAGFLMRWVRSTPVAQDGEEDSEGFDESDGRTQRQTEKYAQAVIRGQDTTKLRPPSGYAGAWLEIEHGELASAAVDIGLSVDGRTKYLFGQSTMMRLGREADNEICLAEKTVHRYHATIHRSDDDGRYTITDLSGEDGNGVIVNDVRLQNKRLTDGDRILLGRAVLVFHIDANEQPTALFAN